MKINMQKIFIFVIALLPGGFIQAEKNLITNGSLDNQARVDNLWDGVDSSGNLKFYTISKDFIESGTTKTRAKFSPKPVFVDINNDGLKDLVVSGTEGVIFVFINKGIEGAPVFGEGQPIVTNFGECARSSLSDWDNDGKLDIICGRVEGDVLLAVNIGTPEKFRFVRDVGKPTAPVKGKKLKEFDRFLLRGKVLDIGRNSSPCVVDFNNDKVKDLILGEGTYSANVVYLFVNDNKTARKTFDTEKRTVLVYGEGREHLTPEAVDWDEDGDLDIVMGMRTGHIELFLNKSGNAENIKPMEFAGRFKTADKEIKEGAMSTVFPADWNNDGLIDLITGDNLGNVKVYLNTGKDGGLLMKNSFPVEGKDVLKEYFQPSGWKFEKRSSYAVMDSFERGGTQTSPSRKGMYVYYAYGNSGRDEGGSEGDDIKITSEAYRVIHGKKYRFTFDYKGSEILDFYADFRAEYGSGDVKDGQKIDQLVSRQYNLKPSKNWKTFNKRIKVKGDIHLEIPDDAVMSGDISFHIKAKGSGEFYLDNVSLVEIP